MENSNQFVNISVLPFTEGIYVNKGQGLKILEEAAEVYTAYDEYMKTVIYFREDNEADFSQEQQDAILNGKIIGIIEEGCDTIQAIVNLLAALTGNNIEAVNNALEQGMNLITGKNLERGYYGDIREESDEEGSGTNENGDEETDGGGI